MRNQTFKTIVLSCFGLILCQFSAFSQENSTKLPEKLRFLNIGCIETETKDQLGSPLLYIGNGLDLEFGNQKNGQKWQKEFRVTAQFASVKNRISGEGFEQKGSQAFAKFSETILRRTHLLNEKWPISVGGQVNFEALINLFIALPNNALQYRLNWNIAPAASISHAWSGKKRDWIFGADLAMPLLGFSIRPGYLGVATNQLSDNTALFGEDGHFSSLHNLLGFDYRLKIDRPLTNGNRFQLAFRGLLFSDKTNKSGKVQFASSAVSFGFLFNIPSKKRT
jgi:hypothetical protein